MQLVLNAGRIIIALRAADCTGTESEVEVYTIRYTNAVTDTMVFAAFAVEE